MATNNSKAIAGGVAGDEASSKSKIYFDYNGSTPCPQPVVDAMSAFLSNGFGNPSGHHWASQGASDVIEEARQNLAHLIGASASEIILTSGATEANNLAIKGVWQCNKRAHFITSAVEHDAVLRVMRFIKTQGAQITVLPVDRFGIVDPQHVRDAIRPDTALISIMHANNETGTIQPIAEISEIARDAGVLTHSDAAQSVGKIPVNVANLGVDLLSIAGHKFGAPNGIGALYRKSGVQLTQLIHGGGQEGGMRAGTESALLAAGLSKAAEATDIADQLGVRALRDYFWDQLQRNFGNRIVLNGHPAQRVPNTLSVGFPGHNGAEILSQMPHLAATTGSACHAGCSGMSHVLIAMNVRMDVGVGTIRFSLGKENTATEVDQVVRDLKGVIG